MKLQKERKQDLMNKGKTECEKEWKLRKNEKDVNKLKTKNIDTRKGEKLRGEKKAKRRIMKRKKWAGEEPMMIRKNISWISERNKCRRCNR